MSDALLLFFVYCLTFTLELVCPAVDQRSGHPIVKIFHLPGNKVSSPQLLYDSAKRNLKDRNVTIPLNTSSSSLSSYDESSSEFVYKKFRYYFECRSTSGPIEWVYNGLGAPHVHVQNERHPRVEPKNSVLSPAAAAAFRYTSTIWLYTGNDREESATGQYTCRSMQRHTDNTTFYVFISGRREFMLDAVLTTRGLRLRSLEMENVAVHRDLASTKCRIFNVHMQFDGDNELSNDGFWMTFPCSVSKPVFHLRPKAHVILYKVNITSAELTFLPLNSSNLTFDPRSGFRVHSSHFFKSWNSSYFICASNNVKTLINITLSMRLPSRRSNHNRTTTALDTNTNIVKVNFNSRSQEFLCSYYTSWINKFEAVPCYSMIQCQFAEAGLKNYLQAQSMQSGGSDSDVDVDVNAFDQNNEPKSLSGGGPTIKTVKTKVVDYEFMDSGFVYCWNRIKFDAMRFYKLRNGSLNIISTTDRLPMDEDILQVGILPANDDDDVDGNAHVHGHNGSITFYCEGSRLFVAQPLVWELSAVAVALENETKATTSTMYKQGKLDSSGRKIIRSMLTLHSYELRNYNYIRVECHPPILNSNDWVHVAIPSDMLTRVARRAAAATQSSTSTAAASTWSRVRIEIITLSMQITIVLITDKLIVDL